jgi:hypothetical protein
MESKVVTAVVNSDVVGRIHKFKDDNGIKHFSDAVEAYITHLESIVGGRATQIGSLEQA